MGGLIGNIRISKGSFPFPTNLFIILESSGSITGCFIKSISVGVGDVNLVDICVVNS